MAVVSATRSFVRTPKPSRVAHYSRTPQPRPAVAEALERRQLLYAMLPGENAAGTFWDVTQQGIAIDLSDNPNVDDTPAIQRAIDRILDRKQYLVDNQGNVRQLGADTLYFPDGVYNVRGSLNFGGHARSADGTKIKEVTMNLHVRGRSRTGTVIKLRDNTFTDAANPKAILNLFDDVNSIGGRSSNVNFTNSVDALTINAGNNPGAIGLNFHNNNVGAVRDVSIVGRSDAGAGVTGIRLGGGLSGIGTLQRVSVQGFKVGIQNGRDNTNAGQGVDYHVMFALEEIELRNQTVAGIVSRGKGLTARRITSTNTIAGVPAVRQDLDGGQVVLTDSRLSGAGSGIAIESSKGHLLARDVITSGFTNALYDTGSGANVTRNLGAGVEYVTNGAKRLWTGTNSSVGTLDLPVLQTPDTNRPNGKTLLLNVSNGTDITATLQAAIDSTQNYTDLYLPRGKYFLSDTVTLGNKVRRLHGNWSQLQLSGALAKGSTLAGRPIFRVTSGSHTTENKTVTVEQIDMGIWAQSTQSGAVSIRNDSSNPLVLRDVSLPFGPAYRNKDTGVGPLFVENVFSGGATGEQFSPDGYRSIAGWQITNGRAWLRHINHEGTFPHIENRGGTVWVWGFKGGEEHGTYIRTNNFTVNSTTYHGKTEVLGAIFNSLHAAPAGTAAMENQNAHVSASFLERSTATQGSASPATVREIRGTTTYNANYTFGNSGNFFTTRQAPSMQSPVVPLYSGFDARYVPRETRLAITAPFSGAPATGSSAGNAVDGNESTAFQNDGQLSTAWITLDAGSDQPIHKVRLLLSSGNTRTYPMTVRVGQVSGGSTTWQTVFTGSTNVMSQGYWEVAFPPTVGSRVRIDMTAANSAGTNVLGVREAEVWRYNAPTQGNTAGGDTLTVSSTSASTLSTSTLSTSTLSTSSLSTSPTTSTRTSRLTSFGEGRTVFQVLRLIGVGGVGTTWLEDGRTTKGANPIA